MKMPQYTVAPSYYILQVMPDYSYKDEREQASHG